MSRRLLRLWTAGCLAVLLVLGVSRLGDWSLQWPVLLVPLLWALPALVPRRRGRVPAPLVDELVSTNRASRGRRGELALRLRR